jgi:hypothetical protein
VNEGVSERAKGLSVLSKIAQYSLVSDPSEALAWTQEVSVGWCTVAHLYCTSPCPPSNGCPPPPRKSPEVRLRGGWGAPPPPASQVTGIGPSPQKHSCSFGGLSTRWTVGGGGGGGRVAVDQSLSPCAPDQTVYQHLRIVPVTYHPFIDRSGLQ